MSDLCKDNDMSRLLHAYELGMISDEDKDRFETHLLECEACFEHVKEFMPRGAMLGASPEIKELLNAGFNEQKLQTSLRGYIRRMFWPDGTPIVLKPAILAAVLILMLYPAYLGLFDSQQKGVAPVGEIGLVQARSEQTFIIERDQSVILSFVCPERGSGQTYSIVLKNPGGVVIHEEQAFSGVDNFRVGRLLLGAQLMSAGNYKLSVRTNAPAADKQSQIEYMFRVTYLAAGQ